MNEIRQKFEALANSRGLDIERFIANSELYAVRQVQELWTAYSAAYEAGEIAMREKAQKKAVELADAADDTIDGGLASSVVRLCAQKIGALAISGAEESKKEKS